MRAFPVEAELPDDLTADERRVVEDAHAGRATVFPAPENKEDLANWRTVRASVLVALLLGPEHPLTFQGLRVQHACITGSLDCTHAVLPVPLRLENCLFPEKVIFADAFCPALVFSHGTFRNGLDASGSRVDNSLQLAHTTITGHLHLRGASTKADLDLTGAALLFPSSSPKNPTVLLNANNTIIGTNFHLGDDFRAEGKVQCKGAKIGGQLFCRGGKFRYAGDVALQAQNIETGNDVFPDWGFEADWAVLLLGAKIGGILSCSGGRFSYPGDVALNAQGIETRGGVFLGEGFDLTFEANGTSVACRGQDWRDALLPGWKILPV